MNRFGLVLSLVALAGCDPTVSIGDGDAGLDAGSLGGAGGGAGGGTGGGSGGGTGGGGGGDPVCNRWGSASSGFFAGQTSCVGTSNTITADPDAQNTCLSGIAQCSSTDRTTLDSYLNCLEQAPRCTAGNENTAVNGFMNCVSTAFSTLSTTCRTALVRLRPAGKRVFLTRAKFDGNLGGLTGADAKCAAAATGAGLNGSWQAWLSTTTVNAIDRLADVGPWVDLQGATMFPSKTALIDDGPSGSGLWLDERGMFLSTANIWTATNWQGVYNQNLTVGPPCAEWTSSSQQDQARVGQVGRTGTAWTWFAATSCSQTLHLICFEQ
jgi:hypothetical protein